MSDNKLKNQLVRLAYTKPELRPKLLPLLKAGAPTFLPTSYVPYTPPTAAAAGSAFFSGRKTAWAIHYKGIALLSKRVAQQGVKLNFDPKNTLKVLNDALRLAKSINTRLKKVFAAVGKGKPKSKGKTAGFFENYIKKPLVSFQKGQAIKGLTMYLNLAAKSFVNHRKKLLKGKTFLKGEHYRDLRAELNAIGKDMTIMTNYIRKAAKILPASPDITK